MSECIVEFKDFSRLLRDFPVLFKADLIFKDFSRKPYKFKYFSSLCEPCSHSHHSKLIFLQIFMHADLIFKEKNPNLEYKKRNVSE